VNPTTVPPAAPDDRARFYADDAAWYVKQLPLEHFMHSTAQATQEAVTAASFDLISAARLDVHCFGELLIQYPVPGLRQPGRVVPDNFVVVHDGPLDFDGSYPLELAPAGLTLVMEYVSKGNKRKYYDDNLVRYEQALRVPYFLLFYPDNEELTLFRLVGGKYQAVHANAAGRLAVPELELDVGILDGWARFWFRDELVPIPTELQAHFQAARAAQVEAERERDAAARERDVAVRQRDAEKAARAELEAELARLRALLGGQPG
jgi:hypothetical protein